MQKLTSGQVNAILSLHETVLAIKSTSISSGPHGVWVDVHSAINADWNDCKAVLYQIFPNARYMDKPRIHQEENFLSETFRISDPSGVHIILYMQKAPAPTEAVKENLQTNCTIDLAKVESFLSPEYLRELLEDEA